MDDLFHKILVHLYNRNSLHNDTDITDFLKDTLGKDYNNIETLINLRETLGRLKNSGFVKISKLPLFGQSGNGSSTNNLDEHNMVTSLELLGHSYIADKIRQSNQDILLSRQTDVAEKTGDSVISTNDFTKDNAEITTSILIGTLIIAAISAIASIRSCQISNSSNNKDTVIQKQSQALEGLKMKIEESESVSSSQQKTIDSLKNFLLNTKTKDTTEKKLQVIKSTKDKQ